MDLLEKQFKAYMKSGKFMAGGFENDASAVTAPDILSDGVKDNINAAGFESTAITAAIAAAITAPIAATMAAAISTLRVSRTDKTKFTCLKFRIIREW